MIKNLFVFVQISLFVFVHYNVVQKWPLKVLQILFVNSLSRSIISTAPTLLPADSVFLYLHFTTTAPETPPTLALTYHHLSLFFIHLPLYQITFKLHHKKPLFFHTTLPYTKPLTHFNSLNLAPFNPPFNQLT